MLAVSLQSSLKHMAMSFSAILSLSLPIMGCHFTITIISTKLQTLLAALTCVWGALSRIKAWYAKLCHHLWHLAVFAFLQETETVAQFTPMHRKEYSSFLLQFI